MTSMYLVPAPSRFVGTSRPPPQGPPSISKIRSTTSGLMSLSTSVVNSYSPLLSTVPAVNTLPVQRHGKAPPVDPFTAEDPEIRFDDWLPTLERAAIWNGWSEEETLIQLVGYLRNTVLQEWNLLSQEDCNTFRAAVNTLRAKLDSGNQTLSALDFHHTV